MFDPPSVQPAFPAPLQRIVDWLRGRERPLLMLGVAFQLVVLVGMIVLRVVPHLTGDTVLLRTVPVDPRDMFRGDYVILRYEFSSIPPGGIPGLSRARARDDAAKIQGTTVYVSLEPDPNGRHYRAAAYSLTPPPDGMYLRGTIQGWNQIQFGIESYYVQEGKGREYEAAIRQRRLSAEVAVAPNGQAALKGLRIE